MAKINLTIYCLLLAIFTITSSASAGQLNLTIVNEKDKVQVVKYVLRYGPVEMANPLDYPYVREIIPDKPVIGEFHGMVQVIGNGIGIFASVKDVYLDPTSGEQKETAFSESSFAMMIPKKPFGRIQ